MLYVACDHAAYQAKRELIELLQGDGRDPRDLGHDSDDSCAYPEYAIKLARLIQTTPDSRGILLCGSGVGVSMAANRFAGVRAALCATPEQAELSRRHNNANVLCLGARGNQADHLWRITYAWLTENFEGGRHSARLRLFEDLGERPL